MPPRKLRILFAPYYPDNPYQLELKEALRMEGVAVSNATLASDMLRFRQRYRYMRPHILHLHWPDKFCMDDSFFGTTKKTVTFLRDLTYIRAAGTKIVWTVHNLMNHERRHVLHEFILQRWLAKHVSAFIVHSEAAKQRVRKRFGLAPTRIVRVHPIGNSVTTYPNTIGRESARQELGITNDRFVFLFLGRIQNYKGVDDLLRAYGRTRELDDALLLLAGKPSDDSYGEGVRRQAAALPNVKSTFEHIADDRIQVFMNAADVVVTPYRRILSSSATMLAMTFGKPVVAPRFPEIEESVGAAGAFFHEPNDLPDLARAMVAARRAGDQLPVMGAANLERARACSWTAIAKQTRELYMKLKGRDVFLHVPVPKKVYVIPELKRPDGAKHGAGGPTAT